MNVRLSLVSLVALGALARGGHAQAATGAANPVGVWRGTSRCLVRPSPCNEEVVVYRITRVNASDSLSMDARKIVREREEEMGVLGCQFAAREASLRCPIPHGVWHFTVRGDSLRGELRLPDKTKFRDVRAARSR